jgi:hypothetical protein
MRSFITLSAGLVSIGAVAACTASEPATAEPAPPAAREDCGACTSGVCDPQTKSCVDPWVLECANVEPGACSATKPFVCAGAEPPSYDCAKCGCPEAQSCAFGVCLPDETQRLARKNGGIPTDLAVDDYFAFVDSLRTGEALTLAELTSEVVARMHADRRRVMLNLGESHGSDDEQAVGIALVRALADAGFHAERIGIEGGDQPILDAQPLADLGTRPLRIDGDLTNTAYCKTATAQAGPLLNDEAIYVQYSGSGHTSQEACYHPEHYSICSPPHTAECVRKTGRRAITVNLFDPDPWLGMTDTALLWRAGNHLPDVAAFDRELEAGLAAWASHVSAQEVVPKFAATANARGVNVRFVASPRFDDVWTAYFPRPGRQPFLSQSFKSVWSVPELKKHLVDHAIRPQDCSISWDLSVTSPGTEKYWVFCEKDGAKVEAALDMDFVVKTSSME